MAVVDTIIAMFFVLWRHPFRNLARLENGRPEKIFASIPMAQQNFLIFKSKVLQQIYVPTVAFAFLTSGMAKYFLEDSVFTT
jgi:hypothetical protein